MLPQYQSLLAALREVSPDAHIAGGAVRDTLLDRPIKDIDLFLDNQHIVEAAKLLRTKFGYVKVGEWTSYGEFSDPAVIQLAKFEKADETIPVCLIGLDKAYTLAGNVSRFDFGICMAAFDGEQVHQSGRFNAEVSEKTFTLYRADNQAQFNYSLKRFETISARYTGWELVIPEEFEELVRLGAFRENWYRSNNSLRPKQRSAA